MALKLYNTGKRQKEPFAPGNPKNVTMYVCGPTVYNYIHIGNARPAVVFDTLFRVLQALYPTVSYARNITDIDDKIMKAAKEQNTDIAEIAERFTLEYERDMQSLNNLSPTIVPKATEHLQPMIELVQSLVEKGHAYEADGHVLFDVKSMPDYGRLSNCDLEEMKSGARVEVATYKKYAGDFVLWKPSADDEPGWTSPWGRGRPGWHLECSAMIKHHLGTTIDIHGGGRDLIFPHHENERAQSQCAHGGENFVRYWVHNGYINIDGEKMAKSLNNFVLVRELLQQYHGEVIRYALLSAQYRSELDFSPDLLAQAKSSLDALYTALSKVPDSSAKTSEADLEKKVQNSTGFKALLDDLNTPLALSELHQSAKQLNIAAAEGNASNEATLACKAAMVHLATYMGLLQCEPGDWFQSGDDDEIEKINALVKERDQAKLNKDYARADEIRNNLKAMGIVIEDSKDGSTWKKL